MTYKFVNINMHPLSSVWNVAWVFISLCVLFESCANETTRTETKITYNSSFFCCIKNILFLFGSISNIPLRDSLTQHTNISFVCNL